MKTFCPDHNKVFSRQGRKKIRLKISLIMLVLVSAGWIGSSPPAQSSDVSGDPSGAKIHLDHFRRIPVQHQGRFQPMDTFAANMLLRFSGKRSLPDEPARAWLARLIFQPEASRDDAVFLINHPSIPDALNIPKRKNRRYAFADLESTLPILEGLARTAQQIEPENRDVVEQEIIRVFNNVVIYAELSQAFSFARTHEHFELPSGEMRTSLGFDARQSRYSLLDLALKADILREWLGALENIPAFDRTDEDRRLIETVTNVFAWISSQTRSPLNMIPPYGDSADEAWMSPWQGLQPALRIPDGRAEYAALQSMVTAYRDGNQEHFDTAIETFTNHQRERTSEKIVRRYSFDWEIVYNDGRFLYWAKVLSLIGLFVFAAGAVFKRPTGFRLATCAALGAALLITAAIALRMLILARAPVSNLYETFVFVGMVCVWAGLLIEKYVRGGMGILTSLISGLIFLLIASKFSAEGDTLQVLVAVLNSNFWLSTHVISITIGYAGACLAGLFGHFYLVQTILHPRQVSRRQRTYRVLVAVLGFGLLMTFLGTNLGGIWADQSWGRFWGWDPKENGALMIVLWIALLLHARVGNLVGPVALAAGSIFGLIVVMWAWFGVNLLSIGLHSYGFTSGLARNLTIYVVLQIVILLGLTVTAHFRLKTANVSRE